VKPDIDGLAIEIAKGKGKMPPMDGPEPEKVSPEQMDDANEMIQAMKTGDAEGFAHALLNFLDSDNGGGDEPPAEPAPSDDGE
jgi:hypothetical protein